MIMSVTAINAPADAAQVPIGLRCCSGTLLTRVQLLVHQDPQVSFGQILPVLGSLFMSSRVQDLALVFVKLHTDCDLVFL